MDLESLQSQLRVAIQNHQIVLANMGNDPQNLSLQKQLHDLQAEIRSLSEKQKQVVQQLRDELEKKKQGPTVCSNVQAGFPSGVLSQGSSLQPQELRMVCSTTKPQTNHRIAAPHVQAVALTAKPIPLVNSLRQPVPPTVNIASSTTTLTLKAPVGAVVLPNCSTTTTLITSKTAEHPKLHPVLVVPSPSNRSTDGPQTGVLLNLVPPIRVPQYPPPITRATGQISPQRINCSSNSVLPCSSLATTTAVSMTKSPASMEKSNPSSISSRSPNIFIKPQPIPVPEKIANKIDQKKKDYMLALGLVTKESLIELKNKRMERKRRSTANPQFSHAALEERMKIAAASQSVQPTKRPRGRPRSDSKIVNTVSNGIQSVEIAASQNSSNGNICASASNATSVTTVVNGMIIQKSPPLEGRKVEELLSELCIVCTQPGDLVKCYSCAKQQHLSCMQPPLLTAPEGQWQCTDCQSRSESLPTVHSYVALKAAKDDEKMKLLKKSLELRYKRSQLDCTLRQLKDLANKQKDRQSELQVSLKDMETCVEHFKSVIAGVKQCS